VPRKMHCSGILSLSLVSLLGYGQCAIVLQPFLPTKPVCSKKNTTVLVMLSIVLSLASKAASAIPPCSITTIGLSRSFGAIIRKFNYKRIWIQALKTQSFRKPACRVYPDKVRDIQNAKRLNKRGGFLHSTVLKVTLVVLYCNYTEFT